MIKEYIYTGKTTEQAIENGLTELGLDRDSVSVEIMEMPSSKFLGLVKTEARVKITVEVEDKKVVAPKVCAPVPAAPMEKRAPRPEKSETPKQAPRKEFKSKAEAPKKEFAPKAEAPKKEFAPRKPEKPVAPEQLAEGLEKGKAFLSEILTILDIKADIVSNIKDNCVCFTLTGEGMGLIIGRRGDTLDSLQYLTSLTVNKGTEGHIRVNIDTENYREKREQALMGLANKVSHKVLKTQRSMTLEPMNPYERRIIHSALQDVANITTKSIGSEPNRKVVVMYEK